MKTIEELNELILSAAESGNAQNIKELILEGADVNTIDKHARTPLHLASIYILQNIKTVIELIENGANINAQDNDGETPLHLSACYDHREITIILVKHGADVCIKDKKGNTPLHLAARYHSTEISMILTENGADINSKNNNGWTPLHLAAGLGKIETTIALIKEGADLNLKNNKGHTPFDLAFNLAFDPRGKQAALALIAHDVNKLFENRSSIKILGNKIKDFFDFEKSSDELKEFRGLTAHQAAARGGFTERAIELLRDYPSSSLQDSAESLAILAKSHKKYDTAAAIQSLIASQAIDSMLRADAKARPISGPGKS